MKVMEKRLKFVSFEDWSSEGSLSSERQYFRRKTRPSFGTVLESVRRGFERGSERIKSLKKSISFNIVPPVPVVGSRPRKEAAVSTPRKGILDPQGQFLQTWNKIFVFSCVIAVSLDPLFFYTPYINSDSKTVDLDEPLAIVASVVRSLIDIFYVLHIIFQFRTGFIAPSSRVFGRGELIDDPVAIAKRYLSTYFIIDVLSILPLPQVVVFVFVRKALQTKHPLATKDLLKSIIFIQYVPRFIRIYPLFKQVTTASGIMTETAWAGAAFNLLLYMLASHVVGALWYLFAIESQVKCWHEKGLDSCPVIDPDEINDLKDFNFGIFFDALNTSKVVEPRKFMVKYSYCFWWGLRNLSSLGQSLKTSTHVEEIIFAVFISIFGLVLFSSLIGNMQKYLQSTTVRVEEMRVNRTDAEQWMSHRMLPVNLRQRIRRYEQYKWQETRGVEEDMLIRNLPKDLRRDIKRHLCLDLLKRVPLFKKMDEQLLDALCDRLKPVLYTENSYIVREGDPVDEMLFIMRGNLTTMTTNGGRTGFFNSVDLKAGDFCGEELLTWALDPHPSSNLPNSTRTVQALTEVETFALTADDLKFVAAQFRRLHSKQLRHTFRFYSLQWKTWAACFIEAAWRRHCKRKQDKALREAEARLQEALADDGETAPSLGATIYASRFAANALRNLRQNVGRSTRVPQRLLPLLPQKPAEPNFDAEDR